MPPRDRPAGRRTHGGKKLAKCKELAGKPRPATSENWVRTPARSMNPATNARVASQRAAYFAHLNPAVIASASDALRATAAPAPALSEAVHVAGVPQVLGMRRVGDGQCGAVCLGETAISSAAACRTLASSCTFMTPACYWDTSLVEPEKERNEQCGAVGGVESAFGKRRALSCLLKEKFLRFITRFVG